VLRDGVIAERGGFTELMRRNGVFAGLYNTQFRVLEPSHRIETAALRVSSQQPA
jgi:hypothetical protein